MGWTNTQAETITGLALTYLTTTVLFSLGSVFTLDAGATFSSATDLNLTSGADITFDGDTTLSRDAAGSLTVNGAAVLVSTADNYNQLDVVQTTISAVAADVTGVEIIINKKSASTGLRFDYAGSCFSTVNNTVVRFSVNIVGIFSGLDICQLFFNTANEHTALSGSKMYFGALPPGPYTCRIQWLRASGTGTITKVGVDYSAFSVSEC